MRVFIAGFCHESSSFSPIPTTRQSFEVFDYFRPERDGGIEAARNLNGIGGFVRKAEADGAKIVLSTYAFAQPSAPMVKRDYESIREEILDDLRAAGEVDLVLFFLHGAQMAQGYVDCEADILGKARDIVGNGAFIGALLDLHTNISEEMIEAADALVACRHYPHIDFDDRAEHLYDLAKSSIEQARPLEMSMRRIPMLGRFYTTLPKIGAVNDATLALQEAKELRSISLIHGFAWTDSPNVGAAVLAVYPKDDPISVDAIQSVADAFFDARAESLDLQISIDESLDVAIDSASLDRPVVIADQCDNAGGGAPSDSTFILQRILERNLSGFALGIFWDPVVIQLAFDAGEGAELQMRLGGKLGPVSGDPLDVQAKILKLKRNMYQEGIGYTHPIGDAALLEIQGNLVVVSTVRGQVFSPTCFTDLGVDLSSLKAVVVKSSQHFHDQFAPLASQVVYCETLGSLTLSFKPEMFSELPRPMWPIDDFADA